MNSDLIAATLEDEIRARVNALCAVIESTERGALDAMLAADFTIVMGLGQILNRAEYLAVLPRFDAQQIRPLELRVVLQGGQSVAICTGIFDYRARRLPEQSDYEHVALFHTMIWIREEGAWRLSLMQGTRTTLP